jgi:hypothetical protein
MLMRKTVMGLTSVVVLAMTSVGTAQTKPAAPAGSESHTHGAADAPAESPRMPMMTPDMMAMCSQMRHQMGMMGMGMGPGMMGGMSGASDPKAQARTLRFRADMMKAMSDVMLKHAAELEKAK